MRVRKTYPLLPWFGVAAAAAFLLGAVRFFAGPAEGETQPLLVTLAVAVVLAFLGLAFPRRAPASAAAGGAHLDLSGASPPELEAALAALEKAHQEGSLTGRRYEKARAKLQEALGRGRA